MSRYYYTELVAMCFHGRSFGVNHMREAVAYLKTQPQTAFTGLCATVSYKSEKYTFQLGTSPMVSLEQIAGKLEAEVWEMFDRKIDDQISYFEGRFSTNNFRV